MDRQRRPLILIAKMGRQGSEFRHRTVEGPCGFHAQSSRGFHFQSTRVFSVQNKGTVPRRLVGQRLATDAREHAGELFGVVGFGDRCIGALIAVGVQRIAHDVATA